WMELGNWWNGGWRAADVETEISGNTITFNFRPVNAKEFSNVKDYAATFRYTLKIRVAGDQTLPPIRKISAMTDSQLVKRTVQLAWREKPGTDPVVTVFNGSLIKAEATTALTSRVSLMAVTNSDPNTF